jgi:hypothetical protein
VSTNEYSEFKKAFREADEFILQLRGFGNVEMHPDPQSKTQMGEAANVADAIHDYEQATRDFEQRLTKARSQMKEAGKPSNWSPTPDAEQEDLLPVTQFVVGMLHNDDIRELLIKRHEAALELLDSITTGIAFGVIRPAEGLLQKLKGCEEDKRRLSRQILEYKKDLKLA